MIQIINTGVANIRSLQAAFDRLGCEWKLTEDASEIQTASHVVLPGVGAFAAAAESLDRLNLRDSISDRINRLDSPTLCICLGMQLLCESSEEAGSTKGLGILPHMFKRFDVDVKPWIKLVEIVDLDARQVPDLFQKHPVDTRFFKGRVGKKDKYFFIGFLHVYVFSSKTRSD